MVKIKDVVKILSKKYEINEWWEDQPSFVTLISIILSQRTYWKNVKTATDRFTERFKSLEDVAKASVKEIEKAIKPAGLCHMRALRIKALAEDLIKEYDGKLDVITSLSYTEAKKKLVAINGIGPKTADVFLMAVNGEQVLPVDVHIFRIIKRLGIADEKDNYESLRAKLEAEILPNQRINAHLILIEFGRQICRAQNPKCGECSIKKYCKIKKG